MTTCRPSGLTATAYILSTRPASKRSRCPVARSQTAAVASTEPVTACRPSGLTATDITISRYGYDNTESRSRVSTRSRWPVARSQTAAVPSSEPVTTCRPSGLTATAIHRTPVPVEHAEPLAGGQVPDRRGAVGGAGDDVPAVGAHRYGITASPCPASSRSRCPVARSQTATVPSREPVTTCRPSGLTATARHRPRVPGELMEPLAGGQVPDRRGAVVGAGDDVPAVRAHRHGTSPAPECPASSRSRWPVARSQTAAVPSREPVTTCRPSGLTATARHPPRVPGELAEPLAGGEVPDRRGAVVGAGDDVPAVRAHRHGTHRPRHRWSR